MGNPPNDPSRWTGFTLRLVKAKQNESEGGLYGNFRKSCHLYEGEPFLVLPLPMGSVATTHVCAIP